MEPREPGEDVEMTGVGQHRIPPGDPQAVTPSLAHQSQEKDLAIDSTQPVLSGSVTPKSYHGNHPGVYQVRERLRHFLHPNGKRIHVAASPEDAVHLRARLEPIHAAGEYEITVSGTPEHLDALRAAQIHHQDARERLRQQHPTVYDQFDLVHGELNALAAELDRVATHGVSLDAHFDRFGYSAHVRSYDDDNESPSPGTRSPRSSIASDIRSYERGFATHLKLFKVPTLRQYFHKGILWRAKGAEEVQSFELFVDLLYVGILQILGDHAANHANGLALVQLIITFTLAWKIWNDMCLIISWFETDDILQRMTVLFLLACLFGYTTNTTEAFHDTFPTLIGFYLAARLLLALYLLLISHFIPMIRPVMLCHVAITLVGSALWIAAIHVAWPGQLGLIFSALAVDLFSPVLIIAQRSLLDLFLGQRGREWFDKKFEFIPAINIEHRTERTNAFVSLVFGFSVVGILYQSARNGINQFYGKAVLGLIQIFCFNWLYFEIDSSNLRVHAIRRSKISSVIWSFAHLPFILSFVLAGGGLAKIVIAYDSDNTPLESLTEHYRTAAESAHLERLPRGLRWFYCAGLGAALLSMGLISLSHIHREHQHTRLKKRKRLRIRLVVAVLLILMPLYVDSTVSSMELVAIVTGLVVFLLVCELTASSDASLGLCGRDTACSYTGRCNRGQLLEIVRSGRGISLDGLAALRAAKDGRYTGHAVQP